MADSDLDYLQPGFDPRTVNMPRLRSIMVTHNVQYPSTAKKQELVDLFNQNIAPMAKKLLDQRARVKRMSSGIVDAEDRSLADDEDDEDDEEEEEDSTLLSPPSHARRSVTPRQSVPPRQSVEPSYQDGPSSVRTVRTTRRSASRALSVDPESNYVTPMNRRTRASMTPQVVVQQPSHPNDDDIPDPTEGEDSYYDETSVFTDDNPFQSGGSPSRYKTPATSRKSMLAGNTGVRRAATPYDASSPISGGPTLSSIMAQHQQQQQLQQQFQQQFQQRLSPRLHSPAVESSRMPSTSPAPQRRLSPSPAPRRSLSPGPFPEYQHEIDAGEEFTPEALEELERDVAAAGQAMMSQRRGAAPSRGFNFATPLKVLFFAVFAAYAGWYRQEKIAVGYCGLGRAPTQVLPPDVQVPHYLLPLIEPQCEPCPAHAYCYENFVVRCETGFVLKPHPLSLGGLVPIPPTCEPDGEKSHRVKAVADKAIDELRARRAEHECGTASGEPCDSAAIKEQALKEIVSRQRRKKLAQQEFDDLWDAAIGEVKTREEIEVTTETRAGGVSDTYLSSSSLARLPVTCAVKRAAVKGLERHRFGIGAVVTSLALILYMRRRYRINAAAAAKVPALVDIVLDRLSTQKENADEEYDDPWLFLPNLRDDVLRSIHSLSERERIWVRVIRVVEQNANVRTAQRESRSGEVGRAWEWIGPTSGDSVLNRRKVGRVAYGAEYASGTGEPAAWGEGKRPIY